MLWYVYSYINLCRLLLTVSSVSIPSGSCTQMTINEFVCTVTNYVKICPDCTSRIFKREIYFLWPRKNNTSKGKIGRLSCILASTLTLLTENVCIWISFILC